MRLCLPPALSCADEAMRAQDFLIDEKDFVEGPEWKGLNPTLPIYI